MSDFGDRELPPELAARLLEENAKKKSGSSPALCQCTSCLKYLAVDRQKGGSQMCKECDPKGGLPLAQIRGPEGLTPAQVELLGLLTEECGEISQRIGKILRWGLDADFHGSSQTDKLHGELGDLLAVILTAARNGLVDLSEVVKATDDKLNKLWEDASPGGPRQRLGRADPVDPTRAVCDLDILTQVYECK